MQAECLSAWKLHEPLSKLCKHNSRCASKLNRFLPKQIWTKKDRDEILVALADIFLGGGDCVVDMCIWLGPLILEVVSRLTQSILQDGHSGKHLLKKLAVVMSRGFPVSPVLQGYALDFVHQFKPFMRQQCSTNEEPPRKKAKKNQISDLDWCHAMWSYIVYIPQAADKLDMASLSEYLSSTDGSVRWYASLALSKYYTMSEMETSTFFKKYFTPEEQRLYSLRIDKNILSAQERLYKETGNIQIEKLESSPSHTLQSITSDELSPHVVSVMGILLPRMDSLSEPNSEAFSPLVLVPSTQQHLLSLALAVSCCRPVLLQGPVGCGKTSLVQHLAMLTGRHSFPDILKIQLGDQTDSKALLGTYCSTEVPGEFVWRAGVLAQAVSKGSWVLLEDVDTASNDVLSLLVALAETRTLFVPGHGDEIKAAPGFQLFTTQRLLSSSDGFHHLHGGHSSLLEKLSTVISVEPLSRDELKHVIAVKFPALVPVSERLLDIYLLLSSGKHDLGEVMNQIESHSYGKFVSSGGRQISTRDLMTWCSRSNSDFDHLQSSQGLSVFLEAVDCFVTCIAKQTIRLLLAAAIGARLNITEDRSKYFLTEYKPSLQESTAFLEIGRAKLQRKTQKIANLSIKQARTFSYTRSSLVLLEKVAVAVNRNEPVLLSGETGTGKTSTIQFLSHYLGHKLWAINLNQQSDSTDLLGGFKPVDMKFAIMPLREEFETLFCEAFSRIQNEKFLSHIQTLFAKKRWSDLLTLIETPVKKALGKFDKGTTELERWTKVSKRIYELRLQIKEMENVLTFSFIEGSLVKALRNGDWILLDEINLATAETLECLSGLLESTSGSIVLTERGDSEPIKRHPEFRLFACMNPATDVGKKDLPIGIRNRFTEFYVEELECSKDLSTLVRDYLPGLSLSSKQVSGIVNFYLEIKNDPVDNLTDGTGHKPHFSLRTLCRALMFCARNPCRSVPRSLYEGFCLSFLTQLDRSSHPVVENLILKHILPNTAAKAVLGQKIPKPDNQLGEFVQVENYWISKGTLAPFTPQDYIITSSVKLNLKDLARVVSAGKHAVLLQGETSVGKTSLITYLAHLTGNVYVRVNNHEHTDLQEYIGSYTADEHGKLVFKEGVLVEAMRKGHWIILDELNLAPTDVLEALNRLLDDNQELYIPETQEMVHAHPRFILFATQNPPGLYGGRKVLSRAFRNRFIELHFDSIPPSELEIILHERCGIPLSYAKRLVAVMLELQTRRRGSGIFSGKHGFMTLRDLFRWAERYNCPDAGKEGKFYDWDQHLAEHGYMLLAGRVRKVEEEIVIQEVIEKHLKRKVHTDSLYTIMPQTLPSVSSMLNAIIKQSLDGYHHIVWTHRMRRLAVLIGQAIAFKEPILLVGGTGVGKTTICQLYAAMQGRSLLSINCHMHTESADFLGGLRPIRSHEDSVSGKENALFEWKDGPLVTAMRNGAMFLIDEISLADDSVLERLNSVLEPERTILLAEKGGCGGEGEVEKLHAAETFQVFATMNPGGDFGKKELSPALRNRFTEIWCPQLHDHEDLIAIIERNIHPGLHLYNTQDCKSGFGHAIMGFIEWFKSSEFGKRVTVSIRDILSWVSFINTCSSHTSNLVDEKDVAMETEDQFSPNLDPIIAYVHGACLVFIDSLGAGSTNFITDTNTQVARLMCLDFLHKQLSSLLGLEFDINQCLLFQAGDSDKKVSVTINEQTLCISPFHIKREPVADISTEKFALQAPTTCMNGQRLLRGLQLARPILLEGSPGVGKTSLVTAIARLARKTLVRINLSEQTDVTDLFGADLPVEGEESGRFAWRDGPFLQALKAGHWIVFDELNLASQSVLEGLNACFDHRAEVYIPELGKTFYIQHEKTRIFACQNPLIQGGGRKGLPRSFLNRFTQVYVDPLTSHDLCFITRAMYPEFPEDMLLAMVDFSSKMFEETMVKKSWGGKGAPWEFNLRDLFRWCDLLQANQTVNALNPGEYVGLVYKDRMRTAADKSKVEELYVATFEHKYPLYQPSRKIFIGQSIVQVGHSFIPNAEQKSRPEEIAVYKCLPLHRSLEPLESLMKCVEMGWLTILVGPQSSGKTSLVRLLSKLAHHPLSVLPMNNSMDTTELLGGFEQSDIWRHLGLIKMLLEAKVRTLGKECLLEKDSIERTLFQNLDHEWTEYKALSTVTEGLTFQEVTALLSQHSKQLKIVTGQLEKVRQSSTETLLKIQQLLLQLSLTISNMKPGAGGGAFEWVDSALVKALKNGDWLLIDNVNFCSTSVLDRLNALLEPKGVLSINERGTVNGKIVSVKPHPEFRLFLAMDPKHGEISRAMRNRGIEIYLLGEDDSCLYSRTDIRAMLEELGLKEAQVCDWWLTLHTSLKSELPFSEKPVIADLLQAGTICAHLINKGFSLQEALSHAAEDVYVSSKRNSSAKQLTRTIVAQHVLEATNTLITTSHAHADLQAVTKSWAGETRGISTMKENAKLMLSILDRILHNPSEMSITMKVHLRTATLIFLSVQSENNWKLALEWLQSLATEILTKLPTLPNEKDTLEAIIVYWKSLVSYGLEQIFDGALWSELKGTLERVFVKSPKALALWRDQPWDLTFNPQASKHLALLHVATFGQVFPREDAMSLNSAEMLISRIQLMQICIALVLNLKEKLAALEKILGKSKKKSLHPSVGLVSLLLSHLTEQLPQLVIGLNSTSFASLCQEPWNLLWISRLADMCLTCQTVHKDVFIAHLALHWHWLEDKLGSLLTYSQIQNTKLATLVQELKRHLGGGDISIKQHIKFWAAIGHPKPFSSERKALLFQALYKITAALTLSHSDSQSMLRRKVEILNNSSLSFQVQVMRIMIMLVTENHDEAEKEIEALTSLLTQKGLMQSSKKMLELTGTEVHQNEDVNIASDAGHKRTSQFMALWPLFGHIALLAHMSEIGDNFQQFSHLRLIGNDASAILSEASLADDINYIGDYDFSHTPDLPDWKVVKRKSSNDDFMMDLHQMLNKLWSSSPCYKHQLWMNWSDGTSDVAANVEDLGPAMLYCASVSKFAMHILFRNSQNTSETELLSLHVSLGDLHDQAQEIWLLSRHFWCHGSTLANPSYDVRLLGKQFLLHSFLMLMQAVQTLLDPKDQASWHAALKDLELNKHLTQNILGELQNLVRCSCHHFPAHISVVLSRCLETVYNALCETHPGKLTSLVGHGLVYVGLVLSHFLSPKGPVDPVEKARLKLDHVNKEIAENDAELSTWNQYYVLHTGKCIEETHTSHLHPKVLALQQRQSKLQISRTKLEQCSAYRPNQLQFTHLSQVINNFVENSCSVSKISDLIRKLNVTNQSSNIQQCHITLAAALQEERIWQDTTQRFIHSLMDNFQCYMDIVIPFCVGLQMMKFGLRLMAEGIHKSLKAMKLGCIQSISSAVTSLCSFPTVSQSMPEFFSLAKQFACSSTHDTIIALLQSSNESGEINRDLVQGTKSRLLLCSLLMLKAHCFSARSLDKDLLSELSLVLKQFSCAWAEQEEWKKQKEAEESALFRYKDQTHGDERSDKELEEADFRASYPSFEKHFIDVTGATRLEDVGLENTTEEKTDANINNLVSVVGISPKEMAQVFIAHKEIYTNLSYANWLEESPSHNSSLVIDILTPSLMAYQIGSTIIGNAFDLLDSETDYKILGSHLLAAGSALQYLDPNSNSLMTQHSSGKMYNFYYDANVPEIIKCREVINSLRKRVKELQVEWPDHPTLVILNQIMDRILSFSVTNPVVKFLTGLELLLQKAQDWESNASSFVSMATQLSEITAVIVQWRKLELSCWSSALDREEENCKEKASYWWFHLFQVTSAFLHGNDFQSGVNTADTSSQDSILDTLKKFMESSTMGEYSVRLEMLLAFHCQLLHVDASSAQKQLMNMLWNIYQFYKQYQPSIEAETKRLRAPIDKQLRDFVKIARWSDLNYWALKASTEKTHRTVHKYIKEYQAVLNQPSKSMLGDKGDDLVVQSVRQISNFPMQEQLTLFTKSVTEYLKKTNAGILIYEIPVSLSHEYPLLVRVPSLFKKMKKHLISYLDGSQCTHNVTVFDDFTGELIQEIHRLQGLNINMNADKEKQKSEAKSLNVRKRKALSELFKYLTQIGLSYRKGVSGKVGLGLKDALSIPPLNLQAHPRLPVTSLWAGCESYFYRCLSRYTQFSAAISSPSKELTMADIERIRGFIEHFSRLYTEQRRQLTSLTSDFLSIRTLLDSMNCLQELSSQNLPPQSQSHFWMTKTKQLATQVSEGLLQFMLLLKSCPSEEQKTSLMSVHPSPFPKEKLAASALWCCGDTAWTECFETIQVIMKKVSDEQTEVNKLLNKTVLGRSDLETVAKVLGAFQNFTPQLTHIFNQFSEDSTRNTCCLISSLNYLSAQIVITYEDFNQWSSHYLVGSSSVSSKATVNTKPSSSSMKAEDNCSDLVKDFVFKVEGLLETLLLSVQHVVKLEQIVANKEHRQDEDVIAEENVLEEEDLKDAHLTKYLLEIEKTVISNLNCTQIVAKLGSLLTDLCRLSDEAYSASSNVTSNVVSVESVTLCVGSLLQAMPLIVAFSSLVDSQLGHSIATHRSMGKLLSVLLAVFTELSQKGFCIPPELNDEIAGEGATEFVDIEGGGLGEGEGAKDVSDQIECEDQLEGAKKPGQEENADKSEEQTDLPSEDNAIEMSDDFEGKLHDKEETEKGDDNDDDADEDKDEDMEKQMGDADGEQNECLDERMWGSDEDEDGQNEEDLKDDKQSGGMDKQKEEMVAKDHNKNAAEAEHDSENEQNKDSEGNQPNDLPEEEDDYDDNQVNPHNNEENKDESDNFELPDDINLDDNEKNDKEIDEEKDSENKEDDNDKEQRSEEMQEEAETNKDEADDGIEKVAANEPEPQELENGEDIPDENSVQNVKAEKEEKEDEDGMGDDGTSGQEEEKPTTELGRDKDDAAASQDRVETAEDAGDANQQTEMADNMGGGQDQENYEDETVRDKQDDNDKDIGIGVALSEDQNGHQGQKSNQTSDSSASNEQKTLQRDPGQSDSERSLGSHDKDHRRLKTKEENTNRNNEDTNIQEENDRKTNTSKEFEYVKDAKSNYDAQTIDVATKEQMLDKQAVPTTMEEKADELEDDEDVVMEDDEEDKETSKVTERRPNKSKDQEMKKNEVEEAEQGTQSEQKIEVKGERVQTMTAERPPQTSIHTIIKNLHLDTKPFELDIDAMRTELEQCVRLWSHPSDSTSDVTQVASEAWQKYLTITSALSQELCEQLRLILEPSQATKLKGDYRTGKRLNMRKVIPYIASQFRKDKIWLRRSKPSKRQYQILIAVDDSASMSDNHSKQLAFESLALVSNALTLLESGELSVCSFGEEFRLLHPFSEQFTNQSGAKILQQLSCEQKQTKYGMLLDKAITLLLESRSRQSPMMQHVDTAQLLLVLSDGNGVFREGMDVVRRAVRRTRSVKIFLVFIILDNPERKSSVLDARVPIMEQSGQIKEIKSYMEMFPFPFYVILRDINTMPQILSDALRQWFELVTSSDR